MTAQRTKRANLAPTRAQVQAAYGAVVPDLVAPGLAVLLCGINPSLWSGAVGLHFATPGNRLWPVLHASGWTDRQLDPSETADVLAAGLGITNLVMRATARADELTPDEIRAGLGRVEALARRWRPGWVAFLGLGAYRTATGHRAAAVGPQPGRLGPARVWLLPNPSGLNASWQFPRLAEAYSTLRRAALGDPTLGSQPPT
ncbi:MAG: mismatch-specific DNA-glycosylase [Actinomycetota bacterium]|nr:mismatch-specific DNA-glycosylase [Actinomycetota bacterium]